MVLTPHIVVGAVVASVLPAHPALGFAAGFVSHFLLDPIPHWDYKLSSYNRNNEALMNSDIVLGKNFMIDLFKMGIDFALGFVIIFLILGTFNLNIWSAPLWGAAGAITPDFLQFVYFKWRHEPVKSLQRFHFWAHNKKQGGVLSPGFFIQLAITIIAVIVLIILS